MKRIATLAAVTAVAALTSPTAAVASTPRTASWRVVPAPPSSPTLRPLVLTSVVATSDTNAWAAGSAYDARNRVVTAVSHWNGRAWSSVRSLGAGVLHGLAADTAGDVWAVGASGSPLTSQRPVVARYDGRRWRLVSNAGLPSDAAFFAVSVASAHDVWAAGAAGERGLAAHWNGTRWTATYPPALGPPPADGFAPDPFQLSSLARLGHSHTIVAVGQDVTSDTVDPYAAAWNGTQWTPMTLPPLAGFQQLTTISAVGDGSAWALGVAMVPDASGSTGQPVALHLQSGQWSATSIPHLTGHASGLNGLIALSPNDIWAVGETSTPCSSFICGNAHVFVEHFNGGTWSISRAPSPTGNDALSSVVRVPRTHHLWAVGSGGFPTPAPLVEQYR